MESNGAYLEGSRAQSAWPGETTKHDFGGWEWRCFTIVVDLEISKMDALLTNVLALTTTEVYNNTKYTLHHSSTL